jgi:hypothetical protein
MPDDLRLSLGGNNPPLAEVLDDETQTLRDRRDELLGSASRAPAVVEDDESAGKVADLVRLISACHKNAEAARVSSKEPYLAAGRLVDATYKKITDPLDAAKRKLESVLTLFQRRKAEEERLRREAEARRQREEEDRLRKEAAERAAKIETPEDLDAAIAIETAATQASADANAAQKAAEAKPADLSRARGDLGAVASLRRFWDFDQFSRDTLDLETLRSHLPEEGLKSAVRSFVKAGGRELRGVRIFENTATTVR